MSLLEVVESLARAGADIQEMNTFRKAVSQTKGGRLAEAALPAKVLKPLLDAKPGLYMVPPLPPLPPSVYVCAGAGSNPV